MSRIRRRVAPVAVCLSLSLLASLTLSLLPGCEQEKDERSTPTDVFVRDDGTYWVVGLSQAEAVDGAVPETGATVELFTRDGDRAIWERGLDAPGDQRLEAYAPLFNRTFLFAGSDSSDLWAVAFERLGALAWQRAWMNSNGPSVFRRAVELATVDVFLAGDERAPGETRAIWASLSPEEMEINWARRASVAGTRTIELFPLPAHAALLVGEAQTVEDDALTEVAEPFVATLARDGDVISAYQLTVGGPVETTDAALVDEVTVYFVGRSGGEDDRSGFYVASMSALNGAIGWARVYELQQGTFGAARVVADDSRVVAFVEIRGYGRKPDTDVDILIASFSPEGDLTASPFVFGSRDFDSPIFAAITADEAVDTWLRTETQVQRNQVNSEGFEDGCGRREIVALVPRGTTPFARPIEFEPLELALTPAELRPQVARRFADRFFLCRP